VHFVGQDKHRFACGQQKGPPVDRDAQSAAFYIDKFVVDVEMRDTFHVRVKTEIVGVHDIFCISFQNEKFP